MPQKAIAAKGGVLERVSLWGLEGIVEGAWRTISCWLPTLRAMWSPVGQQVMIPTPQSALQALRAVNSHTGETVVIFQRRKRRREVAELLNTFTHEEVEAVVRTACGRLVLLYLPHLKVL